LEAGADLLKFKAWLEVLLERRRNNSIKAINGKIHSKLAKPDGSFTLSRRPTQLCWRGFFQLALVLLNSITCCGGSFGFALQLNFGCYCQAQFCDFASLNFL